MNLFPLLDPIPLPAPVWLFKVLHIVTLTLHFIAVKILLGGLLTASFLNFFGRGKNIPQQASSVLASRLPIVMTYVINLGVPPLLFAQVLYGPFLYTSSVLIGVYWISVVFLLMGCYGMLYRFADGAAAGQPVAWKGLVAWILAACISRIYSTNMTLMIKPEVWGDMYTASAAGLYLPPHDPTLLPRWLLMLAGGFSITGLWMIWIAGRKTISAPLNRYLAGLGSRLSAVMVLAQSAAYYWVLKAQPAAVLDALAANPFFHAAVFAWYGAALLIFIFSVWSAFQKPVSYAAGWIAALLSLVAVLIWVIVRDGIRDFTLAGIGFDVWQQPIMTNWYVVGLFLVTFVLGIAALIWLIWVMTQAKPAAEGGV